MSNASRRKDDLRPLFSQLCWFIRLRWLAAAVTIVGAWLDHHWLHWYPQRAGSIGIVGLAILFYNILLWWTVQSVARPRGRRPLLLALSWAQLLVDMACLTLLIVWTGGNTSPLIPFYVLDMIFASVLLPRSMAYGGAGVAVSLYVGGLILAGELPDTRDSHLLIVGRVLSLFATVYLTNHITRGLRRQRKRLVNQNRRIKAMTHQLRRQQQAMVQHEKMVALGQMAAGVTHEIANPLASMDSLLQLMQRKPERMRPDAVNTLREQIARINQIIQQMKTFAHPADAQEQTAELNEVVEQSLHMLRFDPRLQQVAVERQYSPDVGSLPLLPQALQQVLINLIINAVDAMAQTAQPKLIIKTERRDGGCLIEVADNGSGVAPEHMGRLFEPFFTTKPLGQGTGLGLSISYSLIQKQGGSISVRSQPGVGTTFTIRLPLHPSRKREAANDEVAISENPATE